MPPTVQLLDVVWLGPGFDQTAVFLGFKSYNGLCFYRFSSQQAVLVFLPNSKENVIFFGVLSLSLSL